METVVMTMTIADLPVMLSSGKKKGKKKTCESVRVSDQAEVYLKHHYVKPKKTDPFQSKLSVYNLLVDLCCFSHCPAC